MIHVWAQILCQTGYALFITNFKLLIWALRLIIVYLEPRLLSLIFNFSMTGSNKFSNSEHLWYTKWLKIWFPLNAVYLEVNSFSLISSLSFLSLSLKTNNLQKFSTKPCSTSSFSSVCNLYVALFWLVMLVNFPTLHTPT